MSNIFGFRTRGELVKENLNLKERIATLEERDAQVNIEKRELRAEHSNDLSRLMTNHSIQIVEKNNEIQQLKDNFKTNLAKEIAQEKKALKIQADRQDKEHADRMKKLESEYAAKIARCDKELESDKASYRKYFRSEHNSKVEKLENENKKLNQEVAELKGENTALVNMNGVLEGQVKSTTELMSGLVKSLPTITAEFTTPDVSAPNVTVGSGNKS